MQDTAEEVIHMGANSVSSCLHERVRHSDNGLCARPNRRPWPIYNHTGTWNDLGTCAATGAHSATDGSIPLTTSVSKCVLSEIGSMRMCVYQYPYSKSYWMEAHLK